MSLEGGCYCKALRYKSDGDPQMRIQCHCRECQYITGGAVNVIVGVPEAGFSYATGKPKHFKRADLPNGVTREFCGDCGTHIGTRSPGVPGMMILKVGTMDDPSVFGKADMAIFTVDAQSFHHVPDGVPSFPRVPG